MFHDLKCWPEYFQAVKSGIKPFELRKDDRGYAVGDVLHLREFDPDTALYTGDEIDKTVIYVLPTKLFGALGEGAKYVIMGLAPRDWTPCDEGLPEENGTYLVFAPSYRGGSSSGLDVINGIMFSRFKSGKWSIEHGYYNRPNCVIAWQPLPEPYNPDHIGEANKKED